MGEPRKIGDVVSNANGTSALATWALWRRIVKDPERLAEWRARNPEQAAAEDRAIEEARAAARERAPAAPLTPEPRDEFARRMRAVGAPPERVADWLGWYDTAAGALVRTWLRDVEATGDPGMLILTGGAGTGKTIAALEALAWALGAKERGPARYATMRGLVALGRWGDDAEPWDRAMDARMLVLDELVGDLDRYRAERLEELLCGRYDTGRPTVITTNLAPALVLNDKTFGARVASRLGDKRACRIVECGTKDLRRTP